MYEKHFGLRQRPFRPTPDSDSYYPASRHEHVLARLLQALADEEGLALLTGAPGTGKTLVCHRLLEDVHARMTCAYLTNTHFHDRAGLLQALLYDLELAHEARSEQDLRLALTDFLSRNFKTGRRTLLLIDEAHLLGADLLEELRLLSNLESRQGKTVQIILAAQPEIEETLNQPELASFAQRLAVRVRLEPLGVHEAADYLSHQIRVAGGRPEKIFSADVAEIVVRATNGVPRLLNQAAHQALSLAHQDGALVVDAEAALEALADLGLEETKAVPGATPDLAVLADQEDPCAELDEVVRNSVLTLAEEETRKTPA